MYCILMSDKNILPNDEASIVTGGFISEIFYKLSLDTFHCYIRGLWNGAGSKQKTIGNESGRFA